MITIPTYWAITVICLIIVLICSRWLKKDLELAGLIPAGIQVIVILFWIIYSIIKLVHHWNDIPQIIKFT